MTLPRTTRSATLALQVLVSGTVQDSLTGAAPSAALQVRLVDRDIGDDYPLPSCVQPDGSFAFYGTPEKVFPGLAGRTYHLQVEASATYYQSGTFNFDVGPASGQPALVARPIPIASIADMQVRLFTGGGVPRTGIALSLDRNQVRLRGQVRVSDDPTAGVAGAQLTLNPPAGPAATTDARGNFEFASPLPLSLVVTIEAKAAGFEDRTLQYEPDYTQPVNTLLVGLKRS